jgi:hypothetical protein
MSMVVPEPGVGVGAGVGAGVANAAGQTGTAERCFSPHLYAARQACFAFDAGIWISETLRESGLSFGHGKH